jgi:uroporphyrinogen decarboxylase
MDHWQRIEAAAAGEPVDRLPISLWRHFPDDDLDPAKLAGHMVAWQREWDFDLVKFMPSGTYGVEDWGAVTAYQGAANGARAVVKTGLARAGDWPGLAPLDPRKGVLGQQVEALRLAARELGGGAPILQTVFSPLTTARKLAGERVFADMRREPEALEAGLRIITDVTIDFALASLEAGAHGLFLATQCASYRVATEAEYLRFGKRYDLEIFAALKGKTRLDLLHVHGEDVMFDLLADYPVSLVNWHDRLTAPTLRDALKRFPQLLVGGVEENRTLTRGPHDAIRAEVRDAIAQTGGRRLMIGPGCVLLVATPDAHIRAAVDAVRAAPAQ